MTDLDYMCPNCVTPWKCNGPHIPSPYTSLGLDKDMALDDAFMLGYRNGRADEHSIFAHSLRPFREQAETWLRIVTDASYTNHPIRDDTPLKDGTTVGDWVRLARALAANESDMSARHSAVPVPSTDKNDAL